MSQDAEALVEIYAARDEMQAQFVVNLLSEQGIQAMVHNTNSNWSGDILPIGSIAPRIVVRQDQAEAARAVVQEFDRHQVEHAQQQENDTLEDNEDG